MKLVFTYKLQVIPSIALFAVFVWPIWTASCDFGTNIIITEDLGQVVNTSYFAKKIQQNHNLFGISKTYAFLLLVNFCVYKRLVLGVI